MQHNKRHPLFRPTAIALAVAGVLAAPVAMAASFNTGAVTQGVVASGSNSELSAVVDMPVGSAVLTPRIRLSADGTTVAGVYDTQSGGAVDVFVATSSGSQKNSTNLSSVAFLGATDDGKNVLVSGVSGGVRRLVVYSQNSATTNLGVTQLTAPSSLNGKTDWEILDGAISSDGIMVLANLRSSAGADEQGIVFNGTGMLTSASPQIVLRDDFGNVANGNTVNTRGKAFATTSSGYRLAGELENRMADTITAAVWDFGNTAGGVNAEVIDATSMFSTLGIVSLRKTRADAISADGEVVAGQIYGNDNGGNQIDSVYAWRHPGAGGSTTQLLQPGSTISNSTNYYRVAGVSSTGNVIAVNGENGTATNQSIREAFVWTYDNGTGLYSGQSIGELDATLPNADRKTVIKAVSGDGTTVVGNGMRTASGGGIEAAAFRWTASSGIKAISQWLTDAGVNVGNQQMVTAEDVSDDGSVVVGYASNGDTGNDYYYVARVGGSGWSSGVINVGQFNGTLAQGGERLVALNDRLVNMGLNGAHHRVLMDNGIAAGQRCAWAVADVGGGRDSSQYLAESGLCGDFGNWRLGLGIGAAKGRYDLSQGGRAQLDGYFVTAEANYGWAERSRILSATLFYGNWDASIKRGYLNGAASDHSRGGDGVQSAALRMRFDWKDVARYQQMAFSPFVSYTYSHSRIDGYTERGGAFPVRYDDRTISVNEGRVGMIGKVALGERSDLRLTAEAVSQFGRSDDKVRGQIVGLNSFNFDSGNRAKSWGRVGVELDHRLSSSTLLSASLTASGSGADSAFGGSVGVKMAF
ncbi:uncharacterized protein YhjY with autotransporter beta-barrel domain [Azonexus fungiphilus]|uniref:Uncharacterized protein YhjY with autotransporter beta-barrel domain n=1 Tax=Azonexus fungiphilus TaxID=146940 RepID=A0A495VQL7_9RHOO|nr:autotransporter domain-containing protein [Azonexus fungiphilus]RKT50655.1 uncharacterized protein YhjY with autotransporter beta-barrel domain [Azonexus fungiphilus]